MPDKSTTQMNIAVTVEVARRIRVLAARYSVTTGEIVTLALDMATTDSLEKVLAENDYAAQQAAEESHE